MIDELFALMRSNCSPCKKKKKRKEIHDLYCFFFPLFKEIEEKSLKIVAFSPF